MSDLGKLLDDLDAARAAATGGEWVRGGYQVTSNSGAVAETDTVADAALIVAAVNNLADLIADARELRALREAVEALAGEWDSALPGVAARIRTALAAALTSEGGERE